MAAKYSSDPRMVDWSKYDTAYGSAEPIPAMLLALVGNEASIEDCDLEGHLCHQHVQLASASLPALPFLLEALVDSPDNVAEEVLFALWGIAQGTEKEFWAVEPPAWVAKVACKLRRNKRIVEDYVHHPNDDIRYYAEQTLEILGRGQAN
jgi:hypothetical protein